MAPRKIAPLRQGANRIDVVISEFGRDVTNKLRTRQGSEEDHLRAPFERMLKNIGQSLGLAIATIGETRLPELSIRPDYAVDVAGARVGYVELKKPGHGVPTTWKHPSVHDRDQWDKFKLLPNVLYSDGETFARFKFGRLQGRVARLEPGLDQAGAKLHAVDTQFAQVITDFLLWQPERPRTLDELVHLVANLCRLLRNDVVAEISRERQGMSENQTFTDLATDWRRLLFPNLTDEQFADQYAQTVTFALLLARVEGVSFSGRSVAEIARLLGKTHSLMGRALGVLTDQPEDEHSVALTTMLRVVGVVDWADFPDNLYAMLYEHFLAKYDPLLRRKSGVYYTPAPLVSFLTRFTDEILQSRLDRRLGFAEDDVIVVDPAMGTGSFLASVVDRVAATIREDEGPGAVTLRLRELANRLIGFENQAAPYAIAELRIHGLLKKRHRADIPLKERRFLADTLDDPDVQLLPIGSMYREIKRSRDGANQVKWHEPVMVVIGNPPYVDKAKGTSSWIERSSGDLVRYPSIDAFRKHGNGRLEYVLSNKYIYFWRWATWKTFDAHPEHPAGIVAMVCSAGFTHGPGFAGMREYLRRTADEGWIIDLSPEGHQPAMETRFFRGNQQPLCIAVFVRRGEADRDSPAKIRRAAVVGTVDEKSAMLEQLHPDGLQWRECSTEWAAPFEEASGSHWTSMLATTDLFPWVTPGVMPDRTWVYSPDRDALQKRWQQFIEAPATDKSALLPESSDVNLRRVYSEIPGLVNGIRPLADETGAMPSPVRVGYRSFDRQWIIPDRRLIARPRPALWATAGPKQMFITEQHAHRIGRGPGLTFSCWVPDKHHFMGHHAGRVIPLFRDAAAMTPNTMPGLLPFLSHALRQQVDASDLLAYVAAITAHSGYSDLFKNDLLTPGIRIPLTRDSKLWNQAVEIGREVLWLHSYGERFTDSKANRPPVSPRLRTKAPKVRVSIPGSEDGMPDEIQYYPESSTLAIGDGRISPVEPDVWNYEVSGMRIVKHWFGYRKKNPAGNRSSELDGTVPSVWTSAMTTELLDLLNVLGRCLRLEPQQAVVLGKVVAGPCVSVNELEQAGILPAPGSATKAPPITLEEGLWSD